MGEHQYERARAQEGAWPRPRQNKVARELAGLATDLPLDARSSVFVRARCALFALAVAALNTVKSFVAITRLRLCGSLRHGSLSRCAPHLALKKTCLSE